MTAPDHRAELIADLRAAADTLERCPKMLVGDHATVTIQYSVTCHFGDEAARIAEVERMALVLGVEVERDERRVEARLDLGRVAYLVIAGTDFGDAAYDAEHSYAGAVVPETVGAR